MSVSYKIVWNPFSILPGDEQFFLLVPPAVLVIMDKQSNFHDFLSFIKCIYTLFKRVSNEFDDCKSKNKCAY